ncbi:MAG: HAD family hydrolase [Anaerolineales bacterium]
MKVRAVFVDFGGVIMRTEDKGPRNRQAERLGMTSRELEKIIFESDSSLRASIGDIPEEAHWQAVSKALGVSREEGEKIITQFFSGDQVDVILLDFLRSLRPDRKVGLISNAWSGLRKVITTNNFAEVFDDLIISAEVGLVKPDPRIYFLALERLGVHPEESVFLDDILINVEAARSVGMNAIQFTQQGSSLEELKHFLIDTG